MESTEVMEEEPIPPVIGLHGEGIMSMTGYNNHQLHGNTSQMYVIMFGLFAVFLDTEQHCHVAVYQFQDLATLFGVNILQHTNANNLNNQSVGQLAIKQTSPKSHNSQDI